MKEEIIDNKNINILGSKSVYPFTAKESGDYEFPHLRPQQRELCFFLFYAYGLATRTVPLLK